MLMRNMETIYCVDCNKALTHLAEVLMKRCCDGNRAYYELSYNLRIMHYRTQVL